MWRSSHARGRTTRSCRPRSSGRSGRSRPAGGRGGGGGGGRGGGTGMRGSQATPIVVDGIMYMPTPYNRVIALEAHTGKEVWVYKSPGAVTNRGVEYRPGDGTAPPMILFVSGGLARRPRCAHRRARPDVWQQRHGGFPPGDHQRLPETGQISLSSPPKVYKNLVITGARVQESPSLGYAGDTRAWDLRTGKMVWQFHHVPQPGERRP